MVVRVVPAPAQLSLSPIREEGEGPTAKIFTPSLDLQYSSRHAGNSIVGLARVSGCVARADVCAWRRADVGPWKSVTFPQKSVSVRRKKRTKLKKNRTVFGARSIPNVIRAPRLPQQK